MAEKLNLYQKIAQITSSLGAIQKDGTAPAAMGGFRFLSHGMVMAHLRTELSKHNIVIIPNAAQLVKSEPYAWKNAKGEDKQTIHTVIWFSFDVVDGDDPNTSFTMHWYGEGHDTSDKGIQKAGTSAEKYVIMKLFKVGDKDDPDAAESDGAGKTEKTQSISTSMNKEKSDEPKTSVAPDPVPDSGTTSQPVQQANGAVDPDVKKKQIEALVWFGAQLPASEGWFAGKIKPQVDLWDIQARSNKLSDEAREAGSGVKYVFNQIAKSHHKVCGEDCPHVLASQLAIVLGGTISE